MRKLSKPQVSLEQSISATRSAAKQQMAALLAKLDSAPHYYILTQKDRENLQREGFAKDLVDNLVCMTQRAAQDVTQAQDDTLIVGLTEQAFDPSLYACESIQNALINTSSGCCHLCESSLGATGGEVMHFAPPHGVLAAATPDRKCFISQAYDIDNLVYVCSACAQFHRRAACTGLRSAVNHDMAMLINPYAEQPRECIRFNPLNGQAFAFDAVCQFYADIQHLEADDVKSLLWKNPHAIPNQQDACGARVSDAEVDLAFRQWQAKHPETAVSRGEQSILAWQLNRPALVRTRFNVLAAQYQNFAAGQSEVASTCYSSLLTDAWHTWSATSGAAPSPEKGQPDV